RPLRALAGDPPAPHGRAGVHVLVRGARGAVAVPSAPAERARARALRARFARRNFDGVEPRDGTHDPVGARTVSVVPRPIPQGARQLACTSSPGEPASSAATCSA